MREAPALKMRRLPPRVYAVMAVTTLSTFGTLVASYQMLVQGPFA